MSTTAGFISGQLRLVIGDDEIDLGGVDLPLTIRRVETSTGGLSFGLGVDLDDVRNTIRAIFGTAAIKTGDNHE